MLLRFSVPIAAFWLAVAVITNVYVPQLEKVAQAHNVSQSPQDAPALLASKRIGKVFKQFDSDSAAMIVLEGDQPLGAAAHHYYDGLIKKLAQDTKHVQHIQDFWGDPLTASGSQSNDGKAALVQLNLAGNQGQSLSNQSVDSVRNIVAHSSPPPGVKAYVTGAAALTADQSSAGEKGVLLVTMITFVVIIVMDLWRSAGFYAVLLYAGLLDIPGEVLESARIDGASGWRLVQYIVIPLSKPIVVASVIFAINADLKVFDSIYAINNGGPGVATTPLNLYMFETSFLYNDYGYGAAIAMLITVVCLLGTVLVFRSSRREVGRA